MITYHLLLKLKDNSSENLARTRQLLLGMKEKIDFIRDLKVAVDVRRAGSSYDLALFAKFDSRADFDAYLPHPAHAEVGNQLKDQIAAMANVVGEE